MHKDIVYYSRSENSEGKKELLKDHLIKTAELSRHFAEFFGEGQAGKLCGLFHDSGKAASLFQNVLEGREKNVMHEAAGAFLTRNLPAIIPEAIYAHHQGLFWDIKDELIKSFREKDSYDSNSGRRFSVSGEEQYSETAAFIKDNLNIPKGMPFIIQEPYSHYDGLPQMLHRRMLLSCLVDADYTASASHETPEVLDDIDGAALDPAYILNNLTEYRNAVISRSSAAPELNRLRNEVYDACLEAAASPPGLFRLSAPTGCGKTLALLAFAAKHAAAHNKRRIIIVLPFLSIIEQNAAIYREICGNVLEAHSMNDSSEETRILSERWSAPVIVTTSVKFFESLFKDKPSRLRFIHNISDSVIVFDEAQTIPHELVGTTLEATRMLCEMFRSTVLFSTATQPDFKMRSDIAAHFKEIIPNAKELFAGAARVNVRWKIDQPTDFREIADAMAEKPNACCVVNRKDHAHELFDLLSDRLGEGCFHISTDMCKAHRSDVLGEASYRLDNELPCFLVSTSCIEAGVDIDFAYMYRALAPLDSVIQCAGRCNRNGRYNGEMTVFVPDSEKLYPSESYREAAVILKLIASRHEVDINDTAHIQEYYRELYRKFSRDKKALVKAIREHDFAETAKQYRFIPSQGANVLVPYEGCIGLYEELVNEALSDGISQSWIKRAVPITVSSYRRDKLDELCEKCYVRIRGRKEYCDDWYILHDRSLYNKFTGLHFTDESSLTYLI